jgi:thiamine kinase
VVKPGHLIGEGTSSEVFEWGNSQVLKLFRPGFSRPHVEVEADALRIAHAFGVPAPAVQSVVAMDDRFGIVMERIGGPRLSDCLRPTRPWTWLKSAAIWADLYAAIHSHAARELPSQRQLLIREIDSATALSVQQKRSAIGALEQLPGGNRLCLGDFSPRNVLMSERGPVVIDWESASCGNPMADIGCVVLKQALSLADQVARRERSNLMGRLHSRMYNKAFLTRYMKLTGARYEDIVSWRVPLAAARLNRGHAQERSTLLAMIDEAVAGSHAPVPKLSLPQISN